jgi:phosphate transport system substrate-binding protein
MRSVAVLATLLSLSAGSLPAQPALSGAGATTASSLMKGWADGHAAAGRGTVAYAANGSVAGLDQLKKGSVQFALSDARVSAPELAAHDLVQFPVAIEGIVPVVNLAGIKPGQLRLTGPVLAELFLGRIRSWNDPAIAALNPGVSLPSALVSPVHRSDGSGSTFLFTSYLAAVSPEWKAKIGAETSVAWPMGVAAKGSDGVVEQVKATEGAIGYVDFGRVRKLGLAHVQLRNKAGSFVSAAYEGFAAAAVAAPWATAPSFAVVIVDQPGAGAWPISGTIFAVMRRQQRDAATGLAVLGFFDYAMGEDGAAIARKLGHVAMPASVVNVVREAWPRLVKTADGQSVWKAR